MNFSARTLRERVHALLGSEEVRLDGIRLDARSATVGEEVRRELLRGTYELAERQLLKFLLRTGDRVVEIGAGIGAIGLLAARIVGPDNVVSFEANPNLEPVIRGNYDRNRLVPTLIMKAVSERGGPSSFHVTPNLLSSSAHNREGGIPIEVEAMSIDHVMQTFQPTVLVVDAEGAEVELLKSADLSGVRAALIELHPHVVGQEAIANLEAGLKRQGFHITQRRHKNIVLQRSDPASPAVHS